MNTIDIFAFWSVVGPTDTVHPADRDVFGRVEGKHQFDLRCLPSCFMGPLRTAPNVLLYLSPGFRESDAEEAKSPREQDRYMRMRSGDQRLPGADEHKPTFAWWSSKTRVFGPAEGLRTQIAVLNIGAYHSRKFNDDPLLVALPSSLVSIDWAQRELFPQAEAGDRIVICLRASRFWGLAKGLQHGFLFAPHVTQSGHMHEGEMRDEIIRKVRARLG